MKKLNNKGYLLVEIVLASAIAFGLATFLITLVIRVKDKNQDLMVENEIKVDQGIIANMIMEDVKKNKHTSCEDIIGNDNKNINISDNKFTYKDDTVYLSKYTKIGEVACADSSSDYSILTIPINDTIGNNYDVKLYIDAGWVTG